MFLRFTASLAALGLAGAITAAPTFAAGGHPNDAVECTATGHWHKGIATATTWAEAAAAAQAAGGYLATADSEDDQNCIGNQMTGGQNHWLGGSDSRSEGNWLWTRGALFWRQGAAVASSYTDWETGEPNNSGNEDCIELGYYSNNWNDLPCNDTRYYVIEWSH